MPTTTIIFNADSNDMPALILEVDFDFERGCKETPRSYSSGGEPAVAPHVEGINSVVCVETDEQLSELRFDRQPRLGQIIGQLCLLLDRKQIVDKVHVAYSEDCEPDPDRNRE